MAGNKILEIMRKTNEASKGELTDLLFGQVTSTNPLKIKIDNRYEISEDLIVLTSAVQDFEVDLTPEGGTRKKYKVHLALEAGEKVIVLRVQGGQKFVIIDRLR